MGFTPAQIDEMSVWEFDAVVNGYIEANTPEGANKVTLTDEETEDILKAIEERNAQESAKNNNE